MVSKTEESREESEVFTMVLVRRFGSVLDSLLGPAALTLLVAGVCCLSSSNTCGKDCKIEDIP